MKLGMYLLGQLSVGMGSMLVFLTARPFFYEVAGASGLFFVALGLWLIMGSTASPFNVKKFSLTLGCLCMALAVGCRPTYFLISFLVPILLFDEIKRLWVNRRHTPQELLRIIGCVCIPYIIVASGLMYYNYIRFDSVFEFGANYMLTGENINKAHLLNPLSNIVRMYTVF